MPFDSAGFTNPDQRRQKLENVMRLVGNEDSWGKGTLKGSDGRYCVRGAIAAAGAVGVLEPPILQAINQVAGKFYARIEQFNDDPATNHAMVCRVLARAWDNLADGTAITNPRHVPSDLYVRGAWIVIGGRDAVTRWCRSAREHIGRLGFALAR